ncbi:MAG TPA: hypothetical protein VKD65_11620 [Candidatus Angelobacter sp.]|nr:hypothetical protein [Candidatus Angelobacter sp.]
MKKFSCFLAVFVLLASAAAAAQAPPVCLPVATPAPNIDGLVATDPFHLRSGTSDPAWATAPYEQFSIVNGVTSNNAAIFIGTQLTGSAPNDLFLGVHVESADQLSSSDIVTLYFDTTNDGVADFALTFEVGPVTPVVSGTNGSPLSPNNTTLFKFISNTWQAQALPAETILKARASYNFTGGPGNGIWELEIHINVPGIGLTASPVGIKFGAKLYVSSPIGGNSVFDWPLNLTTDLNPTHSGPGAGTGGDPAKLEGHTVTASCTGDVQIFSLKSRARNGDDLFYLPKDTDFLGDGSLPAQFQTQLLAQATFVNTGDVLNTSNIGGTNNGNVHFRLLPWGMGPVENVDVGVVPISFQSFGTPLPATTNWPTTKAQWDPVKGPFLDRNPQTGSDHVCLRIDLEGFAQDSNSANNETQINLQYTTMSTHRDKIVIRAPGTPVPGAPKDNYALRVRWDNVPKGQVRDPGHHEEDEEHWWHWFCRLFHHRRKYWQAQFVNAAALGIKPLKAKGYYGLQLAPGEQVTAEIELAGFVMPVPSQAIHVSPRAGGQVLSPGSGEAAVAVTIPAGGMVTVVARGQIAVFGQSDTGAAGQLHNANGFAARELDGQHFLLSSRVFPPWLFTGALIGAFKPDFSDSFFIGTEGTVFAPPEATTLFLAVNDVAGQFGDNSGAGFDLNVVATPPTVLPTKLSWPANPKLGLPAFPQPAANLPMLVIDFARVDAANKAIIPIGYVAYGVYDAHDGKGGTQGGRGNPAHK